MLHRKTTCSFPWWILIPLPKGITAKPGRNKLIRSAGERRKAEEASEVTGFWLLHEFLLQRDFAGNEKGRLDELSRNRDGAIGNTFSVSRLVFQMP